MMPERDDFTGLSGFRTSFPFHGSSKRRTAGPLRKDPTRSAKALSAGSLLWVGFLPDIGRMGKGIE